MSNMNIIDQNVNASTLSANIFADNCDRHWDAGLPVIPLEAYTPHGGNDGKPTGKGPVTKGWQEMQSRMPTDAERASWKRFYRTGNLGLPLGSQSGLVAIDIDTDDPAALAALNRVLPLSPWERVGKKGMVRIYRCSEEIATFRIKYRDADGKLQSLVELLAAGTQIVLPPSIHPNTAKAYYANRELVDCLGELETLPSDIEKQMRKALAEVGFNVSMKGGVGGTSKGAASVSFGEQIGEGGRNVTLYHEGCRLRGMGLGLEAIEAHLITVNREQCQPPLPEDEVRRTALSAAGHAPNEWYELNDTGNGQRFARDHGAVVRYVSDLGIWRTWDGTRWADDKGELHMMRLACQTVEGIKDDAKAATKEAVEKALSRHARASGDRPRLRAMIAVAASMAGLSALSTEFDQLPNLLVAANGVIDLRTGELLPHDPCRLTTRCLATGYRPGAPAPTFRSFLDRVLPIPEVQEFLHVFHGSALHGERSEQLMAFLHGRGRNGKSVYADLMTELLGGYAVATSASTFIADDKKSPDAARSDLMRLQGARNVFAAETPDKRRLDGPVIKRLTGDAVLPCRALYGAETTFPITFNIFLLCNPFPNIDESDDALWARCVRVPFDVVIPRDEQIANLHKVILGKEAEGVLAWLVEGAVAYAERGLTIPPPLVKATQAWRKRIGTVERFVRGNIQVAAGESLALRWMHSEYILAEQRIRGNPIGEESFRVRLEGLGFVIEDGDLGEVVRDVRPIPEVTKLRAQGCKIAA